MLAAKLLFLLIFHPKKAGTENEKKFDVIKMEVPFPVSSGHAATIRGSTRENLMEFTSCIRFNIESYNDGGHYIIHIKRPGTDYFDYLLSTSLNEGLEFNGYHGFFVHLRRYIPGGGLGNMAMPSYHFHNTPFKIDISKWYHTCFAYSAKLHKIQEEWFQCSLG